MSSSSPASELRSHPATRGLARLAGFTSGPLRVQGVAVRHMPSGELGVGFLPLHIDGDAVVVGACPAGDATAPSLDTQVFAALGARGGCP